MKQAWKQDSNPALSDSQLIELSDKIAQSAKYKQLCKATILDIVRKEARRAGTKAELEGRVREKLHRVAALYLEKQRSAKLKKLLLEVSESGDSVLIEKACREILATHASTAERLGELEQTYQKLWKITGVPASILDLAAAFHPFGFRWMGLDPAKTKYFAYDINADFVELLRSYFELDKLNAKAIFRDVLVDPPQESADVAFFLKMYHCLENREAGSVLPWLEKLNVDHIIISLPRASLGKSERSVGLRYIEELRQYATLRGLPLSEEFSPDEHFLVLKLANKHS
ncbi:MAG: hypothetical protein K1X79_05375 [Oligoflexia bacterium]|nr:hypothetical protein [Oligoflexia bacterium]